MSWSCQYDLDRFCKLLNKPCRAGQEGCILSHRVKFVLKYGEKKRALAKAKKRGRAKAGRNTV